MKPLQAMIDAARKSGGAFGCLREYQNKQGRIADYYMRLGVTRRWTLEQSRVWASKISVQQIADRSGVSFADASQALTECTASWSRSLVAPQRVAPYDPIAVTPSGARVLGVYHDADGNPVFGSGLYIRGSVERVIIHVKGTSKPRNFRSDLTKCKAWIRRNSPEGSLREFQLTPASFTSFTFGSETLTPQGLISVVEGLKRQA